MMHALNTLPLFLQAGINRSLIYNIVSFILIGMVLYGISRLAQVEKAALGNKIGAVSMLFAVLLTLWYYEIFSVTHLWIALLVGAGIGIYMSSKIEMIQMPQMVGLLNGFGGLASMLAGILTLTGSTLVMEGIQENSIFSNITGGLAVVVGGLTWTGSAIAAAKLHRLMDQKPRVLPGHQIWTSLSLIISLISAILFAFSPWNEQGTARTMLLVVAIVMSNLFGYLLAIRVGGADMPITISLLNSFSGVAGSIAGMAVSDVLLVAVGGIVGASGLILTQIMCKSMNRNLMDILLGKTSAPAKPLATANNSAQSTSSSKKSALATSSNVDTKKASPVGDTGKVAKSDSEVIASEDKNSAEFLKEAENVIIVPGYGMALAQAQSLIKQLTDRLEHDGKDVQFAIHPVAGRMPGHMNVLLAEVDIPYDKLHEMEAINDKFSETDFVLVVGANDVINPAANVAEGTPIYGMPVLDVQDAKHITICNFDTKPGYAGVPNPLYEEAETNPEHVQLKLGDAKETLQDLINAYNKQGSDSKTAPAEQTQTTAKAHSEAQEVESTSEVAPEDEGAAYAAQLLNNAGNVIIVPGYGMALAQAQSLVKQLTDRLESDGKKVEFAIHPVAGRMPGHMNVLLAEVDIPYDKLNEMDAINDEFTNTDCVIVIGANDVVNPAANTAEGTPIYGMPVLNVQDAKSIIICNFDTKPGYAGVDNPLYEVEDGSVVLLLGDAKETLQDLLSKL